MTAESERRLAIHGFLAGRDGNEAKAWIIVNGTGRRNYKHRLENRASSK